MKHLTGILFFLFFWLPIQNLYAETRTTTLAAEIDLSKGTVSSKTQTENPYNGQFRVEMKIQYESKTKKAAHYGIMGIIREPWIFEEEEEDVDYCQLRINFYKSN